MIRRGKWAMFCMAIWLSGTLFITVVATQNFYTVDRLLQTSSNGTFQEMVQRMEDAKPSPREFMRYLSSELNRLYFQYWNIVQLPLGILTLWLIAPLPGTRKVTWEIVAMLGIVLFLMVVVTPPIISIGRDLDFVPREPAPPALRTFGLLHATYSALTVVILVLGTLATYSLQKDEPNQEA